MKYRFKHLLFFLINAAWVALFFISLDGWYSDFGIVYQIVIALFTTIALLNLIRAVKGKNLGDKK